VLSQGSADIGSEMTATIREAFIEAKAMSQTISRKGRRAKARRNPQRPYVERPVFWTKRWSELHGDMQGLTTRSGLCLINTTQRNSLSGKPKLAPERSDPFLLQPAHIGETLRCLRKCPGNAEGSLRDPVTTAPIFRSKRWRLQPRGIGANL
jgi:hypothetical protein